MNKTAWNISTIVTLGIGALLMGFLITMFILLSYWDGYIMWQVVLLILGCLLTIVGITLSIITAVHNLYGDVE